MAPIARTLNERLGDARQRLSRRGGSARLPHVIASHDVIPLFGRSYFMELLRTGQLPGIQVVPSGVWRCERETFLHWLGEESL
jgi:phosphoribosylcarboxyaminoimidazole (NCAIR) mutase